MATKLIKNDDGVIVRVTSTEQITKEQLIERRDDFERALKEAQADVDDYDKLNNDGLSVTPAVEAPQVPEQQAQALPVHQPEVVQPQPVQVLEQPQAVQPEQPAQPPLVLQ